MALRSPFEWLSGTMLPSTKYKYLRVKVKIFRVVFWPKHYRNIFAGKDFYHAQHATVNIFVG